MKATAGVCLKCGEHLYTLKTIQSFEETRKKLKDQAIEEFKKIGDTQTAASEYT